MSFVLASSPRRNRLGFIEGSPPASSVPPWVPPFPRRKRLGFIEAPWSVGAIRTGRCFPRWKRLGFIEARRSWPSTRGATAFPRRRRLGFIEASRQIWAWARLAAPSFRGGSASASLKPESIAGGLAGAHAVFPRWKRLGFIEATVRRRRRKNSGSPFRGGNASASLKHRGHDLVTGLIGSFRGAGTSVSLKQLCEAH